MDDIKDPYASKPDAPGAPPLPKPLVAKAGEAIRVRRMETAGSPIIVKTDAPAPTSSEPRKVEPEETPTVDVPNEKITDGDANKAEPSPNVIKRFLGGYWHRKLWTLPLTVLVIVAAIFAVPTSRYTMLAYFVARPFAVTVTDSVSGTPVSGAKVTLNGHSAQTDSAGKVSITVPVGARSLTVAKTYYKTASANVFVDLNTASDTLKLQLVATGRQVPVKVINKITGKPIPSATLTVGNTTAEADQQGTATIVLAATPDKQDAVVKADGYNDLTAKVQITTQAVDANTFALVPAGKLYFLSNLSGKIDVVSTNLDGSSRKTVLAGTGTEDVNSTVLLASRDWQYLVLLSKRDGGDNAKLFLISTTNDKLTTIDSTSTSLTLVGWSGHNFVYEGDKAGTNSWHSRDSTLLSYNADTGKTVTIDSTTSTSANSVNVYDTINQPTFVGANLVYGKTWYQDQKGVGVSGQQNVLMSAKPDGTGSKTLKSVDANAYYMTSFNLAAPNQLYFVVYDTNSQNPNYYRVDENGSVTQSSTITADSVNKNYPTYLLSPSGKSTFWTESRDGKNTLFVGDYEGNSGNQIATLSDYSPYGWYSDSYLLVQKSNSELYVLPVAGGTPLKISDYYKPQYYFFGYGGGYGGL